MRLYNSLSRRIEEFTPIKAGKVGMYTCGPTVYDRKQIGNFRTYTLSDLLYRAFISDGLSVTYIMNMTDVGHLTGDNEGDADTGEDRMQKAAKRERKTAWDVAKLYADLFVEDFDKLNLSRPNKFVKATEHIKEQITLVSRLEDKGLTYRTSDGVYFDTDAYGKTTKFKYGELSNLAEIKEGARVEVNQEKRNPRDFALWKFSPKSEKRDMEWESPWGKGFPGWHIECSAMSMKYLGDQFDVHVGGEDIKSTHHPNEIAQSQGVTGKQFVKYWIHGAMLLVDGERMATSKNNNFKLPDIMSRGFNPLALRYLYLTAHYRSPLNFTWSSLTAAQTALEKLYEFVRQVRAKPQNTSRVELSVEKLKKLDGFRSRFWDNVYDDLQFPKAVAVVWEMLKSNIPDYDKLDLLLDLDQVLGLKLVEVGQITTPSEIMSMALQREELRKSGKFVEADSLRLKIEKLGWLVKDTKTGPLCQPVPVGQK